MRLTQLKAWMVKPVATEIYAHLNNVKEHGATEQSTRLAVLTVKSFVMPIGSGARQGTIKDKSQSNNILNQTRFGGGNCSCAHKFTQPGRIYDFLVFREHE